MRFRNRILLVGSLLGLGVLPFVIQRRVLPDTYCAVCASRRQTVAYKASFLTGAIFERHQILPTTIHAALIDSGECPEHTHDWVSAREITNRLDPEAPPEILSLEFIDTARVANFIRNVFTYADPERARYWKETTLKLEFSPVLDPALRFCRFPTEGFLDQPTFMNWWKANAYALSNHLREETEPD